MGPRSLALSMALAAVYAVARPASVCACSIPADSIVVSDAPANGLVIVAVHCYAGPGCFEGELPEELEVVDRITREPVPGTIERIEGSLDGEAKIAWRADEPLTERRQYEVMWQPMPRNAFAEVDYVFDALPMATWHASDIVVGSRLELLTEEREHIDCEISNVSSCGPSDGPVRYSIATEVRTVPALAVEVDAQRSPGNSGEQFVLSAAFWKEGEAEPELEALPWLQRVDAWHSFDGAAEAYCFRVEVRSLIDDSVATHEGCEAHGALGEVGTHAVPADDFRYFVATCTEPPEGYEDVWCEGRAERCANEDPAVSCESRPARCEDEGGDMGDAGVTSPNAGSSGCSVSHAARDGWFMYAVVLALLVVRRRSAREWR